MGRHVAEVSSTETRKTPDTSQALALGGAVFPNLGTEDNLKRTLYGIMWSTQ